MRHPKHQESATFVYTDKHGELFKPAKGYLPYMFNAFTATEDELDTLCHDLADLADSIEVKEGQFKTLCLTFEGVGWIYIRETWQIEGLEEEGAIGIDYLNGKYHYLNSRLLDLMEYKYFDQHQTQTKPNQRG